MLSDELSSVLSGRYVLFNISPLSYQEYIELTGKDAYDMDNFWDYTKWGGLPNCCQFNNVNDIKNYLHSVFDYIILRDIVKRLNLQDVTYELNSEEVISREFGAFNVINDNYPKYVISLDKRDFSKNGIKHLNLIDFLIKNEF